MIFMRQPKRDGLEPVKSRAQIPENMHAVYVFICAGFAKSAK